MCLFAFVHVCTHLYAFVRTSLYCTHLYAFVRGVCTRLYEEFVHGVCMWSLYMEFVRGLCMQSLYAEFVHDCTLSYFGSIIAKIVAKNMIEFEIFDHTYM